MNSSGVAINFAPVEWRRSRINPWPSAIASGVLALMLCALGLLGGNDATVVQAAPAAITQEPPLLIRVPVQDGCYWPVWRASRYLPWDQVFHELPRALPDGARLTEIHFDGEKQQLEVSGVISAVSQLPGLMLRLEDYAWLAHANPFRVELERETGRTVFSLRVDVLPLLEITGETP